jgi:hypothetical protein
MVVGLNVFRKKIYRMERTVVALLAVYPVMGLLHGLPLCSMKNAEAVMPCPETEHIAHTTYS